MDKKYLVRLERRFDCLYLFPECEESASKSTGYHMAEMLILTFRSRISISDPLKKFSLFYQLLQSIVVLKPTVKLSTLPRENELLSFEKYLKESRLPNVSVLELSIVEVPPKSIKILKSDPVYGPRTAPSEFWEL